MSTDPKLREALLQAVNDAGQSAALGRRILAWIDALTSGSEEINDQVATDRRLELIYGEVKVDEPEFDDDDEDIDELDDDFALEDA